MWWAFHTKRWLDWVPIMDGRTAEAEDRGKNEGKIFHGCTSLRVWAGGPPVFKHC